MVKKSLLLSAVFLLLIPINLANAGVVAAEYDVFNDTTGSWYIQPFYENYIIAQTFLCTESGDLESIDAAFAIHSTGNPGNIPITVEIRTVYDSGSNGIQPDFSVDALATGTIASDDPQYDTFFISWKTVAMSAACLEEGATYAIVASAQGTDQDYDWYSKSGGAGYSDGRLLVGRFGDNVLAQQNYDVSFRVNLVPEPATIGLLSLGAILLRRRKIAS